MKFHAALLSAVTLSFVLCAPEARAENWPGYEGLRHQSSSPVPIEGTLVVAWDKRYSNLSYIPDSTTWGITGYMHSRNLAFFNGMVAVALNADPAYPDYPAELAPLTILDAADGSVINCVTTSQYNGGYKNMWDAIETGLGEQILSWDPDTGIVFLSIGGDMPGHSALLPLANAASFSGAFQAGIGAYLDLQNEYPGLRSSRNHTRSEETSIHDASPPLPVNEWDSQNTYPNRCGFFDMQPGSPYMVINKGAGHGDAQADDIAHKYSGMCAKEDWDQYTYSDAGFPIFKMWNGQLVDGDRIYYLGPYEAGASAADLCNSTLGMQVACLQMIPSDNFANDGYSGPAAAETAHPNSTALFHYQYESPPADGSAWNESDNNYRNKAWLVQGDGVWVAWKPSVSSTVQLVRATTSVNQSYDLGVGAGLQPQELWPNIAYQNLGPGEEYIVYYAANAFSGTEASPALPNGSASLVVFDADAGSVKWTYELNNPSASGNYPDLPPNPVVLYFECSRMVLAGKYAVIAWVDTSSGGNALLKVLSLDITAPVPQSHPNQPVPFSYDLGIPAASNGGARVNDIMAVNGVLYVLVTEATSCGRYNFIDNGAQRVIAVKPQGQSLIDVQLNIAPDTGPARVVAVCDATGTTSTGGAITGCEWDFDYDNITFSADAAGVTVSHLFDSVGTHIVGLRVTDSTGRSEVRTAWVAVTPDVAAEQSLVYPVTEEAEINTSLNIWNDSVTGSGRMRCSGTYGGAYGTGEHSRAYINFDPVSLGASYTLTEARLHFNVVRVNNTGSSTVHRMDPADTLSSSSAWADISSMTGVDQDGSDTSPIVPLDTQFMNTTGSVMYDVTDGVEAWLGRGAYAGSPEPQNGFLLCVDDNAVPGTLDTGAFFAGEKDSFQWDWDPGEAYLELFYIDPAATTPESLGNVRPGASPGETYTDASPLQVLWGGSGPVDLVDIQYSTAGAGGPWTGIAAGQANDGAYSWNSPVVSSSIWIRIVKSGDVTPDAVSAYSFEITASGPDTLPPGIAVTAVSIVGTVDDNSSVPGEVMVNGVSCPVTGNDWSATDMAVAGDPFPITITAEDASGNVRQVNLVFNIL
ncbi:MAG: PKD domain-containing protein [Planctomycetes bacterium]|nr:PKD domain-containing protein [Planctomycetota bacterium]